MYAWDLGIEQFLYCRESLWMSSAVAMRMDRKSILTTWNVRNGNMNAHYADSSTISKVGY